MKEVAEQPMKWYDTITFINTKIRYKPGWTIEAVINADKLGGVVVTIEAPMMLDSRTFEPPSLDKNRLKGNFPIQPGTRSDVAHQVMDALVKVEKHEAREFFRVDGELIYDPHTIVGDERYGETT